jgi:hypothetical protein
MTRTQFEQLSRGQQIKTISQYGEFVAERVEAGNRLYLYIINSFYIELLHELTDINNKGLVIARIFDDTSYLDNYLEKANASQLQA